MANSEFWHDRRVVVTGGGGFLGSFVVERLRAAGCRHIVVPRSREHDLRHEDGVTGLLVPSQNPDAMASALMQFVHDPARRRSMGEAGRDRVVSCYSIERSVDALQETYAKVATSSGSQRPRSAAP